MSAIDLIKRAFLATLTYIGHAFGAERLVQWVTVGVAIVGGYYAVQQFTLTRQAYLWTNVYNLEKDNQKLFDDIAANEEFKKCFSPGALQNQAGRAPRFCENDKALDQFRSLLIFYRFLAQLGNNSALPTNYHADRLKQFCRFLSTPTGRYHLEREVEQGPFQREFADAVRSECGILLRDKITGL